jgi:hypothetical protein
MKNIIYPFIFLLIAITADLRAQFTLPHQSQRPPVNPGYPFIRGMFIDCTGDILIDMLNGNALGLKKELNNFIRNNHITYIVLGGLEQGNVFGNISMEKALRRFLLNTRRQFPGIQIGISGTEENITGTTGYMSVQQFQGNACFPTGQLSGLQELNDAVNNTGVFSNNVKRSELCKFFLQAAAFGYNSSGAHQTQPCRSAFDALYLGYRYWNYNSSLPDIQNEFNNYKTILSVMQFLKCNYPCIRNIDAEFLPSQQFTLQAWTAIDQIEQADPLIDRIMLPSFTNKAENVFDIQCKMMHFFSDRFSKPHSRFFISASVESSSFSFCDNVSTPEDHLGNYLNGTVTPSGNMYSVEKMFLDKFNDPNYMCMTCSCRPYKENHYTGSNTDANELSGMMWGPYSMMKNHDLFRINPKTPTIKPESAIESIQVIDMNGRILKKYSNQDELKEDLSNNYYPAGVYIQCTLFENGQWTRRKILL